MKHYEVAVLNQCSVLTDAEIVSMTAAVQKQITRDFAPWWQVDASLHFVPKGQAPAKGMPWLAFLDTSDEAGALGYHDLTTEGLPIGKMFAKTDLSYGALPSVTFSHEALEMLADPNLDQLREVQFRTKGTTAWEPSTVKRLFYAVEVGDPCEADADGYPIEGVVVSDFVTPHWFEYWLLKGNQRSLVGADSPAIKAGVKYDQCGHIRKPLQLRKGGYISIYNPLTGAWHQIYGQEAGPGAAEVAPDFRHRAPLGARRERRKTARDEWQLSTVVF